MKTYLIKSIKFEVYHYFSGLSFIAEIKIWLPPNAVISSDLFIIIIIIINLFRRVFSEHISANATQQKMICQNNTQTLIWDA